MIKFIERVGAVCIFLILAVALTTILFMGMGIRWEDFR